VLEQLRVKPGFAARIADRDPHDALGLDKADGAAHLKELTERIDVLQYRLFAANKHSVLLVLQGLDASGKDGVVRRVFDRVNPAINAFAYSIQGKGNAIWWTPSTTSAAYVVNNVPEPASLALVALPLAWLVLKRRPASAKA